MYGSLFGSVNFRSRLIEGAVVIIEQESNYGGIGNWNPSQFWISGVQLHDAHSAFSMGHFNHHSYDYGKGLPCTCETFSDEDKQRRQTAAGRIFVL